MRTYHRDDGFAILLDASELIPPSPTEKLVEDVRGWSTGNEQHEELGLRTAEAAWS